MRKLLLACFLIAMTTVILEAASKAHLYNLNTGEVIVFEYKNKWWMGHGPIKGTLPTGEKLEGEFSTVPASETSWGNIWSQGVSAGVTTTKISNAQRGSAIVSGGGIVIQCEYIVSALSAHGHGYCTDNHEGKYKIMF
jgi:hypothetical protein